MSQNIAVIGLGSMGFGMAASLVRAGHTVYGADINAARVDELVALGGHAATPDIAASVDVLVCVVLNAAQTETVLFGDSGWADGLRKGAVIVSCATVAPDFARDMEAKAQARGLHYLDAPISGGAIKAASGQLSIMASGTAAAFEAAQGALDGMAETVHHLGDGAGAGSAMKAVNQLLAGVHIAAMGEALAFAASQDLDLQRVYDVITGSAGNSWMFGNRAPHVIENDYAPRSSINIWPKDLGIVSDIAGAAGLPLPMTQTALDQYRKAVEAGLGHVDDAVITKIFAQAGNVTLPGDEN